MGQDVAGTPKLNGTNYLGVLPARVFWQSASAARKVTSLFLGHYCLKVLVKRFRRQMKRVAGSEDKEKAVLDMNMCLSLFTTSASPGSECNRYLVRQATCNRPVQAVCHPADCVY